MALCQILGEILGLLHETSAWFHGEENECYSIAMAMLIELDDFRSSKIEAATPDSLAVWVMIDVGSGEFLALSRARGKPCNQLGTVMSIDLRKKIIEF